MRSLSSPRTADFTLDGIKDVVIADGMEVDSIGHVMAIDGSNGAVLWRIERNGEIYSSAQFIDANADNIPDVVFGGRVSILTCLNGENGATIWEFDTLQPSPDGQGWLQFYEPKSIADRTGDEIEELIVINGGDPTAAPYQSNRRPGHLLLLNGATGQVINQAVMPDSAESYCSIVVTQGLSDNDSYIYFGTGGETVKGSMWRTTLADLLTNDITNSVELISGINKGFIAPPVLADISGDGIHDIVSVGSDGIVSVVNGLTLDLIWNYSDASLESYSLPGIGDLNNDGVLDVVVNMNHGVWPQYDFCVQLGLNGLNGNPLFSDTIGTQLSSPLVLDIDNNGMEVAVMATNDSYSFLGSKITFHRANSPVEVFLEIPLSLNIGSTPLIDDLDGDGFLELITVHYTDTANYYVTCWETSRTSGSPLTWSAYHGSKYDGIYPLPSITGVAPDEHPLQHNLNISYQENGVLLSGLHEATKIYDLNFRVVMEVVINSGEAVVPYGRLPAGTYLVVGNKGNGTFTEIIVLK